MQRYSIDPERELDRMGFAASQLHGFQFHALFLHYFRGFRDRNLQYQIPGTHACITANRGFSLEVIGQGPETKVVVSSVHTSPLSPGHGSIQVGDELLAVDYEMINHIVYLEDGSTPRQNLKDLYYIDGKTNILPGYFPIHWANDEFLFRTVAGELFETTLPWLYDVDDQCVRDIANSASSVAPKILKRHAQNRTIQSKTILDTRASAADINWKIYEPNSSNLGIITINTFGTGHEEAGKITADILKVLQNELKNTNAIVFDVRNVSGTSMPSAADLIPQLFKQNVVLGGGRVRLNQINEDLIAGSKIVDSEKLRTLFHGRSEGTSYTNVVNFANHTSFSPVYFKPVGVFTSADCMGACEVFAANMKDNHIATIFGEAGTTAKCGSNAVDYNSFLNFERPQTFAPLPFANRLPVSSGPNMKVPWQQFMRRDGSLIEDVGVTSDFIIRPSLYDLMDPERPSSQFLKIAEQLVPHISHSSSEPRTFPIQIPRPHLNRIQLDVPVELMHEFLGTTMVPEPTIRHSVSSIRPARVYENEDAECVACQERSKDSIIVPCGHFCLCNDCCQNLDTCPMCRQRIECIVPSK